MNDRFWKNLRNQVVDKRYHLTKLLGCGGFGAVFLASEVVNDRELRKVAVKLIPPHDNISRKKQLDELECNRCLIHPSLLICHSVGSCIIQEDEYLFLVMELAENSLEDYLTDGKMLSEKETLKIASDVALGLQYLHDEKRKLVHRDIKPANIFKVDECWKIGDFGIARQLGTSTMAQSRAFGSAYYAPPESYHGEISLVWDIWSLGVIICRCYGGELPYTACSDAELMNKVLTQPPVIPNNISKRLKDIIEGCLIKDRRQRLTAKILIELIDCNIQDSVTFPIVNHTGIEFMVVSAGGFLYGKNKDNKSVDEFELSKYPVTVAQYREYCQSSGKEMPQEPNWGWIDDHPIVNVSWFDAKAFCDFYGYRLPTEEEWEKAARGKSGKLYPWGNIWESNRCVNYDNSPNSTQPVTICPNGISPFGCMNMAGNVWEWTNSWLDTFQTSRILKGGAWNYNSKNREHFHCSFKINNEPSIGIYNYGFRVAR